MKAADIMTRRATTISADAPIGTAIRIMLQNRISGLPVIDAAGDLVGIVTEGDLLRRDEVGTERHRPRWLEFLTARGRLAEEYARAHGRKIEEVMTREVATVQEDASIEDVVGLMEKRRVKRIPVMRGRQIAGIVSRADILRTLAKKVSLAAVSGTANDQTIREAILAELQSQPWAGRNMVDVFVADGVVQLRGAIFDERERKALHVAAENIPGVKGVTDRLVYVEPVSGMYVDVPVT